MRTPSIVVLLATSCAVPLDRADTAASEAPPPAGDELAMPDFEPAAEAAPRRDGSSVAVDLDRRIDSWFEGHGTRRLHVQIDRPLYRPGDTVWLKTWNLATRGLVSDDSSGLTVELVDPRGTVVQTKQLQQDRGTATNDFVLDAAAPGGLWILRATARSGEVDERPFVVSSATTPRIKKDLEFVREAYGPGDRVEALVEMTRPTGAPLADHPVRAVLQVAGAVVAEVELTTDGRGAAFVDAVLPEDLTSDEGLLTVFVEDGGVTESISRGVPIVVADAHLAFFPEGGDLVRGLPGRVYLEATNAHGEPADVSGVVEDDRGVVVATFSTLHDGMGRFALTPEPGRTYAARITSPDGIDTLFALPEPLASGCTLRSFDDVRSEQPAIRVGVRCSARTDVIVAGVLHEETLDVAAVTAGPTTDTVVHLQPSEARAHEQGAVRVTVLDRDLLPLAERLVYRNPGRDLDIAITADRDRYGPRDEVVLGVRTTGPDGAPVSAELAVSVVDDAIIGLADDDNGHMLSRIYLEPELVDSPKDPGWYFDDDEALAARGLDLVMGTKGWRRFDWVAMWAPEPEPEPTVLRMRPRVDGPVPDIALDMPMLAGMRGGVQVETIALFEADAAEAGLAELPLDLAPPAAQPMAGLAASRDGRGGGWIGAGDEELWFDGIEMLGDEPPDIAAVRVFPKPDYRGGFTGVRTDFRDTVLWEPTVTTDADGVAEVRFFLSDAITTFRVTAEGVGGGLAGHTESTLTSVLPVSMTTRVPPAVSAGDTLFLPVTVSSSRDEVLQVHVAGSFSSPLLQADVTEGDVALTPAGSDTVWFPLSIGEGADTARIRLAATGGGLSDTVEHTLDIVPPGFPRSWSAAGESTRRTDLTVHLDPWVAGSLTATVSWHPSTVSTLLTGMEGMIRTPGGCFEQTSSTNWPNVAILAYLDAHDGDPRLRAASSQALDAGYTKLTGYQVPTGGFETWGTGPGKEALSAFGLLQFADMAKVYDVDSKVLTNDATYLMSRRTGRGGFHNSGESAHGYGSAPADVLDGFITWALVATGHAEDLATEIAHQADVARTSTDPYVLALAARVLVATGHEEADRAVARLAELQANDGSFPGARSSITRSYEANLLVESTALAALALMESGGHRREADAAVSWLTDNRRGEGTWGATQATALALAALTTHAETSRRPPSAGTVEVEVNGATVGTLQYTADTIEPLELGGWAHALRPGENTIVLRQPSGEPLPYTVDISWTSITPDSSAGAEVTLTTALSDNEVHMGDTVRLTATVGNATDRVVPSPIARIGLPAGLEAQQWQLEQLQERGDIAFFETRPREVTLYWDGLHAGESHDIALDLVATIPGAFTGPASSAYPYYNDDEQAWQPGLRVRVDP